MKVSFLSNLAVFATLDLRENVWIYSIYFIKDQPILFVIIYLTNPFSCKDSEGVGDRGPDLPPGKSQKYRVSKQYGSESLGKLHSYLASCLATIGPPAKRYFNGVTLAGRWWPALSGIRIISPLSPHKLKKKKKKRCPSWTPSDKTFWLRAWFSVSGWSGRFLFWLILVC